MLPIRQLAGATTVALALVGLPTAASAAETAASCTDGGGHVWSGRSVWGSEYTAADGTRRISNDQTGFRSTAADATTVDYTVRTYDGNGALLQTLRAADATYTPGAWKYRNPLNPPTSPGRAKIVVNVGDGNDGRGNCTMTFVQPAAASADTRVTLSDVTTSSVTVNWTGITDSTSYLVGRDGRDARAPSGPEGWSTDDGAGVRSRTFDNLLPRTEYTFSVTPQPGGEAVRASVTTGGGSTTPPTNPPTPPTPPAPGDTSPGWLSGAASLQAADGRMAAWRGSAIEIGGTWQNDPALYTLQRGAEWGSFTGPIDLGWSPPTWSGWSAEANGTNDAFWTQMFRNARTLRAGKGTTYIRPWYEYNGNWMDYSVRNDTDLANFKRAFARVDAIQNREFPEAKLMLGTSAANGISVANSYPASGVDVLSIDFYNNWPWCTTTACFNDKIENAGGANSLADLTRLAASKGDPVIISEWSNQGKSQGAGSGGGGESPQFMRDFHAWMKTNAGSGPGDVLGEVQFNLWPDQFELFTAAGRTTGLQPQTAEEYRRLW